MGTSSWTDRSLTHDASWYPKRSMKAAERIAYYAQHFGVTEIETTFRFPPTPTVAQQWVDRTPEGFAIDVQLWSLLTGAPTLPGSLWEDLHGEVRPDKRDLRRLYAAHLTDGALDECWRRVRHALEPLRRSGRLGAVVLRYPRWFGPKPENVAILADARARLDGLQLVAQFSNAEWGNVANCNHTFDVLEGLDIAYGCVDAGEAHPLGPNAPWAATSDLAYVRLHGRRARPAAIDLVEGPGGAVAVEPPPSPGADFLANRAYLYEPAELAAVADRVRHLAASCQQVHVIATTCWQDHAVRNATNLRSLLSSDHVA